jgi:hypothetical protein
MKQAMVEGWTFYYSEDAYGNVRAYLPRLGTSSDSQNLEYLGVHRNLHDAENSVLHRAAWPFMFYAYPEV